ncbi:MAG TPA: nitric-oxide reductase large subunit, partial [Labilithrix sp.]|nr:nitric-oxide reductase large subunit [Labilithrix sp.]
MNGEAKPESRRPLLVARAWVQVTALVFLAGFFVLGLLGYRAYAEGPPIPERVVDPSGQVVFTGDDVRAGEAVFLRNGLMAYGSVFGHGAYLGPDYTADYLRRAADHVLEQYGGPVSGAQRTAREFKENHYEPETGKLETTAAQASAYERLCEHYAAFFGEPTTRHGLRRAAIADRAQIRQLTAFFAWTAWAASTLRPGKPYSYTNNWPPEPRVDNQPTAAMLVWSVLSLAALLGGIGLLFAAYGRYNRQLGWHARDQQRLAFREEVELTPAQRATAWFFLAMAALFLVQTLVGGASQHYRAELTGFFGLDLARVLPFNLART